jgi:hypothetical protein
MRTALALLTAVVLASARPAVAQQPLAVVELFTSQGCSSCPPADTLLGDLARREDVLALSFHVDYWNYIGWEDPYSRPAFTARQRDYARLLGLRHVYTPQMVIQGRRDVIGSDRSAVLEAIRQVGGDQQVPLEIRPQPDGSVRVEVGGKAASPAEVLLIVFDREHRTQVKRGENGGRTLVNTHVVRDLTRLGTWTGDGGQAYPVPPASGDGNQGRAVIVQAVKDGRILAARRL